MVVTLHCGMEVLRGVVKELLLPGGQNGVFSDDDDDGSCTVARMTMILLRILGATPYICS